MTDDVISDLFYDMYDGLNIFERGIKQMRDTVRKNDTEIKKIIGEDNFLEIEEFISTENSEHAHCAFVTGFKYAMRLVLACGGGDERQVKEWQELN